MKWLARLFGMGEYGDASKNTLAFWSQVREDWKARKYGKVALEIIVKGWLWMLGFLAFLLLLFNALSSARGYFHPVSTQPATTMTNTGNYATGNTATVTQTLTINPVVDPFPLFQVTLDSSESQTGGSYIATFDVKFNAPPAVIEKLLFEWLPPLEFCPKPTLEGVAMVGNELSGTSDYLYTCTSAKPIVQSQDANKLFQFTSP